MVQLPYSKECFQVFTLSKKEVTFPPEECRKIQQRGVILTIETWVILRSDILRNCQVAQCKEIVGAVDALFLAVDSGLQKILK